jgi:hypothetical protein
MVVDDLQILKPAMLAQNQCSHRRGARGYVIAVAVGPK